MKGGFLGLPRFLGAVRVLIGSMSFRSSGEFRPNSSIFGAVRISVCGVLASLYSLISVWSSVSGVGCSGDELVFEDEYDSRSSRLPRASGDGDIDD
jgi:hypothetical protein